MRSILGRAGDPYGTALVVAGWHTGGRHQEGTGVALRFEATFEGFGTNAFVAQPGSHTLLELTASLTGHDHLPARVERDPRRNYEWIPTFDGRQ